MDEYGEMRPSPESAPAPAAPQAKPKGQRLKRIAVGGAVSFVFMAVLYGVNQTMQLLALAVICTAGLGLIPILFVSWLVGWIALEVWGSVSNRRPATVT